MGTAGEVADLIIGAVIIFAVLDAPPAAHSALTRSVLAPLRTSSNLSRKNAGKRCTSQSAGRMKRAKKVPVARLRARLCRKRGATLAVAPEMKIENERDAGMSVLFFRLYCLVLT
jgi:hypothetical protein